MAVTKDRAEVAEMVVASMVEDGLSLRKASARHQISAQTFLRAVAASPALAEQYDRARASVIERLADEVLELAGAPVPKLDNGATDPGMVRQRQLQVDTRKWFLSKLAPKVYGDRLDVQVSDSRMRARPLSMVNLSSLLSIRSMVIQKTIRLAPSFNLSLFGLTSIHLKRFKLATTRQCAVTVSIGLYWLKSRENPHAMYRWLSRCYPCMAHICADAM